MSATPQNQDNQEIDLSQISKKIGGLFENISNSIFKGILFLKRNMVWVGALFVIGAGMGFYLDKTIKVYNSQIIVTPNFGSVDYLYSKIELINSQVKDGDTLFLKNVIGIKDPSKFKEITILPIADVYKFIENRDQNFEMIKLMSEDGDIKKVLSDPMTSKNYPYHAISFSTVDETSDEKTIIPILKYLNDSDFYKKIQKEYVNNVKVKMVQNDSTITQIDAFLNTFKDNVNGSQKSDKLVYYNENSQLNDVIKTKDILVNEQGIHRIEMVNLDEIIKESSTTLNVKNTKTINGKMKIILPLLFIFLFIMFGLFRSFYRNQMAKLNS